MASKSPTLASVTLGPRTIPVALRKLRTAANGPRGAEPLTARGVAELCGVELKTVHNWAAEGIIGHFRTPGRHLRFQAVDVIRFLEECGCAVPASPDVAQALVVVDGPLRRRLRRILRGLQAEFVAEPLGALIAAGRLRPDAIIVVCDSLAGVSVPAYLAALQKGFPEANILCVESDKGSRIPDRYQVIPVEELTALRAWLGLK